MTLQSEPQTPQDRNAPRSEPSGASEPAKPAGDLGRRLLTAAVAVPPIIALIIWGGPGWMLFITAVAGFGSYEFYLLMEGKGLAPHKKLGIAAAMALVVLAQGSNEYYITLLLTVTIFAILLQQLSRRDVPSAISGTSVTIFGVIYVGWLSAHLVLLRNLGSEIAVKYLQPMGRGVPAGFDDIGMFFVFLAVAGTFLADTGGYFAGKKFGKHKLAPTVSPKKTWEGLGGSVAAAAAAALVVKIIFSRLYAGRPYAGDLGWGHCLLLGVLIALFGLAGDLAESLLKRDAQIKDASGLLPGHGGFLDRLDSLNFAVPLTYYYIKIYYYLHLTPDAGAEAGRFFERYGF